MRDADQKYYICKSGEVKRRAEEHRKIYLRLKVQLWKVVESFGVTEASICSTMMLIRGLCFKGEPPAGWTKAKHGISYPKRGTLAPEVRKFFTPSGSYTVETHKEMLPFMTWLNCPFHYTYTTKDGSGSSTIGRLFSDGFVYWYDPKGLIMLELPDVAAAKKHCTECKEIPDNNMLDWVPPKGLKVIMIEEWNLMSAKHKKKTEG